LTSAAAVTAATAGIQTIPKQSNFLKRAASTVYTQPSNWQTHLACQGCSFVQLMFPSFCSSGEHSHHPQPCCAVAAAPVLMLSQLRLFATLSLVSIYAAVTAAAADLVPRQARLLPLLL
jgi:hypothetical protein